MSNQFYSDNRLFKWNWAAFVLPIPFGMGNHVWQPLLTLIPVFNIFWLFYCGFRGEKWVWNSGQFEDGRTFRTVMDSWNRGGKAFFILCVCSILLFMLAIAILAGTLSIDL